ncbi:long polar fimbria major subunit LpfA1 [Providencia sp.]
MKISYKQILTASVLTLFSIHASSALEQAGTIKLNGYIYSSTCTVDLNDQGPSMANISMGRYSTSEFGAVGTEVGGTGENGKIKVTLTDCPDNGTITLTFDGKVVDGQTSILELDNPSAEGSAKGVGIHLYQGSETKPLTLDGSVNYSQKIEGESAGWEGTFIAKYVSTSTTVTAGQANATLNYNIIYK